MVVFLLKSMACLAVFLLFYKLVLEKERMHTLKRYYLLAALMLAIAIPSIRFVEYIEVPSDHTSTYREFDNTVSTETVTPSNEKKLSPIVQKIWIDHGPVILWTIYILGVLLFALKFLYHMGKVLRNVRSHPKIRIGPIIHVLLRDFLVPHTFWNYVFLNGEKFKANEIPNEVLLHEATHARQKHSFDILCVELLQIVFWFNPLLHWAKKIIKLNHEFLADEAVLEQGTSTSEYQNTLLSFASSPEYKKYQPSMANAINYSSYSSIKKRFKLMKAQTSKKSILIRTLLIAPLLAVLFYGFSTTVQIPKEEAPVTVLREAATKQDLSEDNSLAKKHQAQRMEAFSADSVNESEPSVQQSEQKIVILVNQKSQLLVKETFLTLDDFAPFLSKLNEQLKKEGRNKIIRAEIIPDNGAPKDVIADVETILNEYGVAQIDVLGGKIPPPPAQTGASEKQLSEYNLLAKKYNAIPKERRVIPSVDLRKLEGIYGKMSPEQKDDAQAFPECPDPRSSDQEGATSKQIKEYNALAKKYNEMLAAKGNIRIKKSEVDRLEYLHGMMTEEQRAEAEPFPDFPEPPEPPRPPALPSKIEVQEQNKKMKKESEEMEQQAAMEHEQAKKMERQSMKRKKQAVEIEEERKVMDEKAKETEVEKEVEQEIIENQEFLSEEHALKTTTPEPPAPPIPPSEREVEVEAEVNEHVVEEIIENQDPYDEGLTISIMRSLPEPPAPPKPKSPLELLEELKKDNVKIILNGKEIGYKEAKKRFEDGSFTRVDVSQEEGKRPVLEVWTD